MSLESQRELLKYQSYSSEFPTSRAYQAAMAYAKALKDFDTAHPEIVASLIAEQARKQAERNAQPAKWI